MLCRDLRLTGANRLDNRPSLPDVASAFRGARLVSYIGATSMTLILVILWPAIATVVGVMDLPEFTAWVLCFTFSIDTHLFPAY